MRMKRRRDLVLDDEAAIDDGCFHWLKDVYCRFMCLVSRSQQPFSQLDCIIQ